MPMRSGPASGDAFSLLKDASRLDIYDANYIYSHAALKKLSMDPAVLPRGGILGRLASFATHTVKSLIRAKRCHSQGSFSPGSVAFFFASRNQRNSLWPMAQRMERALPIALDFLGRIDVSGAFIFPVHRAYLLSWLFFPLVLLHFVRSRGYRRASFRYAFDGYWLTYGCYLAFRRWLRRARPAAVIVADDHGVFSRTLVLASRQEGIPSFHLQHASVTEKFPALSADYALLEGMDALIKYDQAGASATRVFLIGMPRLDAHLQDANRNPVVSSLGICTNRLDPPSRIEELCAALGGAFPDLSMSLRPHPGDRRDGFWAKLAARHGVGLSDSKQETAFEFLKRVDAVVAGDSNILLEAALMNVFPIYYDFTQEHRDWYGFERNGMVEYFDTPQGVQARLEQLLQAKPDVQTKALPYCATVGTPFQGRSSELAEVLMNEVIEKGQPCMDRWQRVPGVKLEAYTLRYT